MQKINVKNSKQWGNNVLEDEIERILIETCEIIKLYMKIKMNFQIIQFLRFFRSNFNSYNDRL